MTGTDIHNGTAATLAEAAAAGPGDEPWLLAGRRPAEEWEPFSARRFTAMVRSW